MFESNISFTDLVEPKTIGGITFILQFVRQYYLIGTYVINPIV